MFNSLITKSFFGFLLLAVMASPADARGNRFHLTTALSPEPGIWIYLPASRNKNNELNNILYAHDEAGRGVLFRCQGERITVTFMVESGDFRDVMSRRQYRVRRRTVEVGFADASRAKANVYYFPLTKTALAKDRAFVAKIFSSAVRTEAIKVKVTRKEAVNFQFPETNGAFGDFAEACPVIN